jgi:hypothetical protein
MAPFANRNRDGQQVVMNPGITYTEHQQVRDMVLETGRDLHYIKSSLQGIEEHIKTARIEWTHREGLLIARVNALEQNADILKGKSEGLLLSAAFVSGVLTLIGMFLAIYISVVMR